MGGAICGMHYAGIAATILVPDVYHEIGVLGIAPTCWRHTFQLSLL